MTRPAPLASAEFAEVNAAKEAEPPATLGDADHPSVSVVLVAPGAAPRRLLRHPFTAGAEQRLLLRTTTRFNADPDLPALITERELVLEIESLDAHGLATVSLAAYPERRPGVALASGRDPARASDGALAERRRATVTPRGIVTDEVALEAAPGPGDLRLVDVVEPLPREPVGVGARWIARRDRDEGGVVVEESTTYDLLRRDADRVEVHFQRRQRPRVDRRPAPLEGRPTAPPSVASTGDIIVVLGRPCTQGAVELHGTVEIPLAPAPVSLDARVDLIPL